MAKQKSKACKWHAYNTKSRVIVRWLGCTSTKTAMEKRLKKYDAPPRVVAKKGSIKPLSEFGKGRTNRYLKAHGMQMI